MSDDLKAVRLKPRDILRVSSAGLRARPTRVLLSALGIAIGIAAMICVVGISSSSRADLDRQLAALGTNLLTVTPGRTILGEAASLPAESVAMIDRIKAVTDVSAIAQLADTKVYRNDLIPVAESQGIGALAAEFDLLDTVDAKVAGGTWLNAGTGRYPAVVLGSAAAQRLGIGQVGHEKQILIGGRYFAVVGILKPVILAPELDSSVLIGWSAAKSVFGFQGHPTTIYTRTLDSAVTDVRNILAATANPEATNEIKVSRPSDALAARQATNSTFTSLLLGLGAVALLVGGVGVANTMVISVLERRSEIGLRRSLGATRGHIRTQFLAESLLLSAIGGAVGVMIGIAVTAVYAAVQSWPAVVPAWATVGGIGATLIAGAIAGLYPAIRAARLAPTEALTTP
jgi:putative ABC transport system permease protein